MPSSTTRSPSTPQPMPHPVPRATVLVLVLAMLMLAVCARLAAAQPSPAAVIVPGNPPITFLDVANHVRLVEFVLGFRATIGLKDRFLRAIKDFSKSGKSECRENLLQARELIQSMGPMGLRERETIRGLLLNDFSETAKNDQADPAARLFLELHEKSETTVIGSGPEAISQLSLDAFCEYVGFAMNPARPLTLSNGQQKQVVVVLRKVFPGLSPDIKRDLAAFDRIWHILRVVLVGDKTSRERLLGSLRRAVESSGKALNEMSQPRIQALLLPLVWQENASAATALGNPGTGWASSPQNIVW